jgi:23S rRNA (uracil1939-C5)-methyltransferase
MTPSPKKPALQAEIASLDLQGRGVFTHDSSTYFVPGAFPGDVGGFALDEDGELAHWELITPSPDRVASDCPHHGPCGGCDFLELNEKARLKIKSDWIKELTVAISPESPPEILPFVASSESMRYRPRLRLHQSRSRSELFVGFLPAATHQEKIPGGVVRINDCKLAIKPISKILKPLTQALARLPFKFEGFYLLGNVAPHEEIAGHLVLARGWTANRVIHPLEELCENIGLKGISIGTPEGKIEKVVGEVGIFDLVAPRCGPVPLGVEPAAFVQGNIFQNPALIKTVVHFCQPRPGACIHEGFAGAGNFSVPLALAGAEVFAVESGSSSFRWLKKNSLKVGMGSRLHCIFGDAAKELPKIETAATTLLIDPPRNGFPSIPGLIAKKKYEKIVYVSCDATALIKDARALVRQGYRLTQIRGFDIYPRTSHLEIVALFQKE